MTLVYQTDHFRWPPLLIAHNLLMHPILQLLAQINMTKKRYGYMMWCFFNNVSKVFSQNVSLTEPNWSRFHNISLSESAQNHWVNSRALGNKSDSWSEAIAEQGC